MAKQQAAKTKSVNQEMTEANSAFDVIYQDQQHTSKQLTDLQAQVQRLQKMLYDKPVKEPTPVAELLEDNNRMLREFHEATSKRPEVDVFLTLRAERESKTRRTLSRYKMLDNLTQKKTKECPCGEHLGIEFVTEDGERVDHLCPKHWWVMQTWLANEQGKLSAFVKSTPLDWYLGRYKKESK